MPKHSCTCFHKVDMSALETFIARNVKEERAILDLVKGIDRKKCIKRELEICNAELFLVTLQNRNPSSA